MPASFIEDSGLCVDHHMVFQSEQVGEFAHQIAFVLIELAVAVDPWRATPPAAISAFMRS